jgi:hypothetical protein
VLLLVELSRGLAPGLMFLGEGIPCCWACTTALCGSVGGGSVVLARGEGWVTFAVRGFRAFFAGALTGGTTDGVGRGVFCGESRELISMVVVTCSETDLPCYAMWGGQANKSQSDWLSAGKRCQRDGDPRFVMHRPLTVVSPRTEELDQRQQC